MKAIHWFSLSAFVLGLVLSFTDNAFAGCVVFSLAVLAELVHATLTGKRSNEGAD